MSALASVFSCKSSATSPFKDRQEVSFALRFGLLNKIADAISKADLYESVEEPRPTTFAVIAAANALRHVSAQDVERVEIEPYSGELSLVWRAGRNRRVKAMFGQERDSCSIYHEQLEGGRVIQHHLEPNASHEYLRNRLTWLRS